MASRGEMSKAFKVIEPELSSDPEVARVEVEQPESVLSDKPGFTPGPDASDRPVREVQLVSPSEVEETPEQREIRELKAQLEEARRQVSVTNVVNRPTPEDQLTPDQKEIRRLQDQLARETAYKVEQAEEQFDAFQGRPTLLIHVLEDGFTANGRVWYRGQEIEFEEGSRAYNDTLDKNGKSWLSMIDDEMGQARRYGRIMVRRGPWPGDKWEDEVAESEERKRNRAAPVLNV